MGCNCAGRTIALDDGTAPLFPMLSEFRLNQPVRFRSRHGYDGTGLIRRIYLTQGYESADVFDTTNHTITVVQPARGDQLFAL